MSVRGVSERRHFNYIGFNLMAFIFFTQGKVQDLSNQLKMAKHNLESAKQELTEYKERNVSQGGK
jgi:hypothetical protein